jgi:ABC-type lipoprotein export system ATPase subunit
MAARLSITSGADRAGNAEAIESLSLESGESLAVIGPTGSGKSEFLADVEQMADRDTPSGRIVTFTRDGGRETAHGLVATLSQRTNFIMDTTVGDFARHHAASLKKNVRDSAQETPALANTLCAEPMTGESLLQRLSGGQTRALMIADIALISDAPVVLIDEVENAGIDKHLAVQTLAGHGKITVIATHDPVLMLSSPKRLVMAMGGMRHLHARDASETRCRGRLETLDNILLAARERLRGGDRLTEAMFA